MVPEIIRKGYLAYILRNIRKGLFSLKVKIFKIPEWKDPDENDYIKIESQLKQQGIAFIDITINKKDFETFYTQFDFGSDFYGGSSNRVFKEKILEHFISYKFAIQKMRSKNDIYIDFAAANSPWAKLLREKGYNAYAIDLSPSRFKNLNFYKTMNATATSFSADSVGSVSLQCAYEMFNYDDNIKLIHELMRILMRGGRVIISPLYMNTHYSRYCSPEFWHKSEFHPKDAKVYINSGKQSGLSFVRNQEWNRDRSEYLLPFYFWRLSRTK